MVLGGATDLVALLPACLLFLPCYVWACLYQVTGLGSCGCMFLPLYHAPVRVHTYMRGGLLSAPCMPLV